MEQRCGLCGQDVRGSGLIFRHTRRGEHRMLSISLCDDCGDQVEKHLKRRIPKRLMEVVPDAPEGGHAGRMA